jgi:hypothetical protein
VLEASHDSPECAINSLQNVHGENFSQSYATDLPMNAFFSSFDLGLLLSDDDL